MKVAISGEAIDQICCIKYFIRDKPELAERALDNWIHKYIWSPDAESIFEEDELMEEVISN